MWKDLKNNIFHFYWMFLKPCAKVIDVLYAWCSSSHFILWPEGAPANLNTMQHATDFCLRYKDNWQMPNVLFMTKKHLLTIREFLCTVSPALLCSYFLRYSPPHRIQSKGPSKCNQVFMIQRGKGEKYEWR